MRNYCINQKKKTGGGVGMGRYAAIHETNYFVLCFHFFMFKICVIVLTVFVTNSDNFLLRKKKKNQIRQTNVLNYESQPQYHCRIMSYKKNLCKCRKWFKIQRSSHHKPHFCCFILNQPSPLVLILESRVLQAMFINISLPFTCCNLCSSIWT